MIWWAVKKLVNGILDFFGLPATLVRLLLNSLVNFVGIPFIGKIPAILVSIIYAFAFLMIGLIADGSVTFNTDKFNPFIYSIYSLFKKKDEFVSHPLKYKKQLNNDGGIGWVPYYGKPGRSCEEDKDCPTFQKCDGDKCVIPQRVR
jgi:hypothetical protein